MAHAGIVKKYKKDFTRMVGDRNASKCNTKEKIQCDKINKKPWWKFWSKKSKKINTDNESNVNPLTPGNETIDENIDSILSSSGSKYVDQRLQP